MKEITYVSFNAETQRLVNEARKLTTTLGIDLENVSGMSVDDYRSLVRSVQDRLNADGMVYKLCQANRPTLERILGGPMSFQAMLYLRAVRPAAKTSGLQENIGFHRESFFGPDFVYSYNVWIPLANIDERSTLFYVPGSSSIPDEKVITRKHQSSDVKRHSDAHRIGLLYDEIEIVDGVDLSSAVRMRKPKEEMAVFPSALIHGNGRNEGDQIRISLDFRIIRTDQIQVNQFHYAAGGAYFATFEEEKRA